MIRKVFLRGGAWLWIATAWAAVTHGQTGSRVELTDGGLRLSATARSPGAAVDGFMRQERSLYGRVTVVGPDGFSTSYGLRQPDGTALLRTFSLASDAHTTAFASGLWRRKPEPGRPLALEGAVQLRPQPSAQLRSQDSGAGDGLNFQRLRTEADAPAASWRSSAVGWE